MPLHASNGKTVYTIFAAGSFATFGSVKTATYERTFHIIALETGHQLMYLAGSHVLQVHTDFPSYAFAEPQVGSSDLDRIYVIPCFYHHTRERSPTSKAYSFSIGGASTGVANFRICWIALSEL